MNELRPIFLVDDNPMDVELTLLAFRSSGMANPIEGVCDGVEAIERFPRWEAGEQTPLVILLDINMPRINGLEVLKRLKSHEVLRVIPVVMLTTSAVGPDVEAAYELGANSYIVKPVDFDKFTQVAGQIRLYWTALNQVPR